MRAISSFKPFSIRKSVIASLVSGGLMSVSAGLTASAHSLLTISDKVANITGSWVFETGRYNQGTCKLTGQMYIRPTSQPNQYSCEFTTFEKCPSVSAEVEQVCSLRVEGDQAAFVSKITRIAEQKPFAYEYQPDDWRLTIKSTDEMIGTLESASRAYVIFKRDTAPTS